MPGPKPVYCASTRLPSLRALRNRCRAILRPLGKRAAAAVEVVVAEAEVEAVAAVLLLQQPPQAFLQFLPVPRLLPRLTNPPLAVEVVPQLHHDGAA
jgi:hypothetical protein